MPECQGTNPVPECTYFHFIFESLDGEPAILSYSSCEGIPVTIEYQKVKNVMIGPQEEDWVPLAPLQDLGLRDCSMNAMVGLKILDKPSEVDVPLAFYSLWLQTIRSAEDFGTAFGHPLSLSPGCVRVVAGWGLLPRWRSRSTRWSRSTRDPAHAARKCALRPKSEP